MWHYVDLSIAWNNIIVYLLFSVGDGKFQKSTNAWISGLQLVAVKSLEEFA